MNNRREQTTVVIWIYNIIALIVLMLLLVSSCTPAPDCEYVKYEVTWKNVAGQEESRVFYLPEEIYQIKAELVDGYPAMTVSTPCGEWVQQIGVIDVISWAKHEPVGSFYQIIGDSVEWVPVDTTSIIFGN